MNLTGTEILEVAGAIAAYSAFSVGLGKWLKRNRRATSRRVDGITDLSLAQPAVRDALTALLERHEIKGNAIIREGVVSAYRIGDREPLAAALTAAYYRGLNSYQNGEAALYAHKDGQFVVLAISLSDLLDAAVLLEDRV